MKRFFWISFLAFFGFWTNGVKAQTPDSINVVRQVDSLIQVSRTLVGAQKFDQALKVTEIAGSLAIKRFDTLSVVFGSVCFNYGRIYYFKGDFLESEKWHLKSKSIRGKLLGTQHPDYAKSLNSLANLYLETGDYKKSETFYLESRSIYGKVFGTNNQNYYGCTNNLVNVYTVTGDYEKAEMFFQEAKSIWDKLAEKDRPDETRLLGTLAHLYSEMGKQEYLESIFIKIKNIRKETIGEEHPDYITNLMNLANLYSDLGNYEKAEMLYLETLSLWEKSGGKEKTDYAKSLMNLGDLYSTLGNDKKAKFYSLEAIHIFEKVLGRDHPDFATTLQALGDISKRQQDYQKAESFYNESKDINEKALGKWHPKYAHSLNLLANLYSIKGDYGKAEPLYFESTEILEKALGKSHISYAKTVGDQASLYHRLGNFKKAESLYLESKNIQESVVGKNQFSYIDNLSNLAILYEDESNYVEAKSTYEEISMLNQDLLAKSVRHLTESELSDYIQKLSINQNEIFEFAGLKAAETIGISKTCYNNVVMYKGFILNISNKIKQLSLRDSTNNEKFNLLKSYERRLSREYLQPIKERDSTGIAELEDKINTIEKDLTHKVAGYSDAIRQVKWEEIRQKLNRDEAALEFVHYQYYDKNHSASTKYVVLVLFSNDTIPHLIPLFEEKQLAALLEKTGSNAEASTQLYASRTGKIKEKAPTYGTELYNLIWKPIDSLLQGVKTVYFSPSGLLHRVSFAALPMGDKKVLADHYSLYQMGSTRSLVVKTPQPVPQNYTATVFGGIQYDRTATATDTAAHEVTDNRLWSYIERPRAASEDGFEYLPGTAEEVHRLDADLRKQGLRVSTHTGAQATEEALKALGRDTVKSPDILHIATHGFFFPDPEKRKNELGDNNAFKWNENPLFRSGLALAGANQAWKGEPTPAGLEDGIATAYEISHLNLSNTKLVVLSACETGLGDIKGSEGVYGLQRAFKMAGANYLLVSLWQVPDKETAEFMDVFYKTWLGGKTIHEAFAKAQKKMRKKYKEVYKWGAWVLVE